MSIGGVTFPGNRLGGQGSERMGILPKGTEWCDQDSTPGQLDSPSPLPKQEALATHLVFLGRTKPQDIPERVTKRQTTLAASSTGNWGQIRAGKRIFLPQGKLGGDV